MSAKNKTNELKLTRVFAAPVAVVWDAWTDTAQVAQWWGPRGFTLTTHSKDLRVGGHWRYTMHGPDGTDYPNHTVYHEVVKHQRLVYDHGGYEDRPPLFRVTVNFHDLGDDRTEMKMIMACPTPEEAEQTARFIKQAGGHSTWDRLAEYLEHTHAKHDVFVIARSFAAPIETVFDMWVQPGHFSRWMGPAGSRLEFLEDTIAVGKTAFYKMSLADGLVLYGKARYETIERPHRIEYVQSFADAQGNLSKHPGVPLWPDQMYTRVRLTAEDDGHTRITLSWQPTGTFSDEELRAFVDMRASMTQGWTQAFDALEELVLELKA